MASNEPRRGGPDRRRLALTVFVALLLLAVVAIGAVWLTFLGSQAPPPPSLDDALQLLSSPSP